MRPGQPAEGEGGIAGKSGISNFGKFDWFADPDHFGDRTRSDRMPFLSWRSPSGALLPGDWAKPGDGAAHPSREPSHSATATGPALRRWRWLGSRRGRLSRTTAIAAGVGAALACTVLGGVLGGYIALHGQNNSGINPSYALGSVPPALMNRPASSVAGIAARITPSVVMIKVNGGEGTGSGFIIRGGYIVTNNHVITLDDSMTNASIEVYFSNGASGRGMVVGRDSYSDLAVIKVNGMHGWPALTLGNSSSVEVGDPVIAVGSPLGLADTVTSGIVSAVNRPVQPGDAEGTAPQDYFDALQTDAPINPGNSGGPLVNSRGQVIGVDAAIDTLGSNPLTGSQGGSIGLGFAIPINQARRIAVELIRTGHADHAVLGAVISESWAGNGAQILPARPGGRATVFPGGPAARAGLMPGDVITGFAGQPVTSAATLLDALHSQAPGARTTVTFNRAGQTMTVQIRLGSAQS
jgi:putative serine protease PepD